MKLDLNRQLALAKSAIRAKTAVKIAAAIIVFPTLLLIPTPSGLTPEGQRVLAILALAVFLWSTELLPMAVTGLLSVTLLTVVRGVPTIGEALYGFSHPVAYFLIGVLTMGLAVMKTGLAERLARYFISRSQGRPLILYSQMVFSFVPLTFVLPSAITRSAILIHIYEQVLEIWRVPKGSAVAKPIMLALTSINRLASTALLTGGVTPVAAAALIGGFSWTRWFVLMSVPYYFLLLLGGLIIFLLYRQGFNIVLPATRMVQERRRFSASEIRVAIIVGGTSLLWLTDPLHNLHPAVPALVALVLLLSPAIGVLSWSDFERNLGWASFFVLTTSLSLAHALMVTGASQWLAEGFLKGISSVSSSPLILLLMLMVGASLVRIAIPNIVGFLALVIPVAMSLAQDLALSPVIAGLAVMMAGDSVLYYSAQTPSAIVVFERGHLTAPEILRFGLIMTAVAYLVVLAIAVPYWGLMGEPLSAP